jgi:hypothetical protein
MKKFAVLGVLSVIVLTGLWFLFAINWSYSTGERAGYLQKLSQKGWLCKTWEGELAMVTMPGSIPEKFLFTVWDEKVVEQINKAMGRRVTLHYEQKVGLPTTCFGETRHWVNKVVDIPLEPGFMLPVPVAPAAVPPAAPAPAPAPAPQPAPASK